MNYCEIPIESIEKNIENPNYIFVDMRKDGAHQGYFKEGVKGHIKNSIQFSSEWIENINFEKFESFLQSKGILKDKCIVLYDNSFVRIEKLYQLLVSEYHYRNVKYFIDLKKLYINKPNLFVTFPNFKYVVDSDWVYSLIKDEEPDTYDNEEFLIFETYSSVFNDNLNLGEYKKNVDKKFLPDYWRNTTKDIFRYIELYEEKHIPGAIPLNIENIEGGNSLNFYNPKKMITYYLNLGITTNKTIILYSRDLYAPFRVAFSLKLLGVKDVRVINGGFRVWEKSDYPTEFGINRGIPEKDFGKPYEDFSKKYIRDSRTAYNMQQNDNLKLVSIRRWIEHTGKSFGYEANDNLDNEIIVGEPKGAYWGFCGGNKGDMDDYFDPDGTLRNPNEIENLWKTQNINRYDKVAFYCGTGWRASVAFFISEILGWDNTFLFDGSWIDWSQNKDLPISKNEHKVQQPDALNDYK